MAERRTAERPCASQEEERNYETISMQDIPMPTVKSTPWPSKIVCNRNFREVMGFLLQAVLFILFFVHAYTGLPGNHQLNAKEVAPQVRKGPLGATDRRETNESLRGQEEWPNGTYALPMTNTGCPITAGVQWKNGSRLHDTQNIIPDNAWTTGIHFPSGSYEANDMTQHFCSKTVEGGSGPWPAGNYCVFKKGDCPSGFSLGFIFWDDENDSNHNGVAGSLPEGTYDRNTVIFYCCRSDGFSSTSISLPIQKPFYLFQYSSACQKVRNMNVRLESFMWDNEDTNTVNLDYGTHPKITSDVNRRIYYCYYYS